MTYTQDNTNTTMRRSCWVASPWQIAASQRTGRPMKGSDWAWDAEAVETGINVITSTDNGSGWIIVQVSTFTTVQDFNAHVDHWMSAQVRKGCKIRPYKIVGEVAK